MTYTGAWRQLNTVPPVLVSLSGTVPNKDHNNPVNDLGDRASFEQSTPTQYFPSEPDSTYTTDYVSGGPVNEEPVTHEYGIGSGAGLPLLKSMVDNESYHDVDMGSVVSRRSDVPELEDGAYHVDRFKQPPQTPGSPGSLVLQQTALGEVSPNQRQGYRISRVMDRVFQRQSFVTDQRPVIIPNAFTAPASPPVANGNQYTSPYPTAVTGQINNTVVKPPQMRRSPEGWDQSSTIDGTNQPPSFGFYSGGL